jgi:nitric oxide reductase activation protein
MSLTGDLRKLPVDKSRAALEISAALAGVSLRVSKEFLQAVPDAAKVLSADEIRNWAEIGRKLAMGNADLGVQFFAAGVEYYALVPAAARSLAFQICLRQLVLSTSVALETFKQIPILAEEVNDPELFTGILKVAVEVAQRSAKHSSDFLASTPKVAAALKRFDKAEVAAAAVDLASQFAARTGGMTSDLWALLPVALKNLDAESAVRILRTAEEFLIYGGSVTLNFVSAGGEILRVAAEVFPGWCDVLHTIAKHGNAVLVSFTRSGPQFFRQMVAHKNHEDAVHISNRVLLLIGEIAETDAESALACFRSSAGALKEVSLLQFEDWVRAGLGKSSEFNNNKAQRSYFALETRRSHDLLHEGREGLPLEKVQTTLRLYIEALTGREVEIAPLAAVPQESRLSDGRMTYLPSIVAEFKDDEKDFRLYKVLAAHAAGQIEFGTYEKSTPGLKAAFSELSFLYEATAEELDSFSLDGYMRDPRKREKALSLEEAASEIKKRSLPKDSDYRAVLQVFPEPGLARKIFGTLENGRVDRRLRATYRGLVRDLDMMVANLREKRPFIFDLPIHQVPFELLFQITLCGGALDDARQFYAQIVGELESVVFDYLAKQGATVADTLIATSRIYTMFQNIAQEEKQQPAENEETGDQLREDKTSEESVLESQVKREEKAKKLQDARDLFNAWNNLEDEEDPDDLDGAEAWSHSEVPEQPLESGDVAFSYDEWDRDLMDHRLGWCRVVEKQIKQGDRNFVELTRSRYGGVISSIRRQFQMMKPENLAKIHKEIDGEEFDLNAVIDYVIDRRADGMQSDRLYTKRLRRQRDVAVSLLLDQSSSTARTITRNPLQPYTHPGRRIIEIEKEGLILMAEALEAVGDIYSIYGFTSEGRRNVKFYMVKDFNERYGEEIERRIGGISFQNNTRLGAAIRHAAAKLQKQDARTKLLIILTDGRPYDHDYGDARYAREDVRESLIEARLSGVTPFCITIDRDSEAELKDLYGDVGYTIIDDVLSLPERMPNIYRRLTS